MMFYIFSHALQNALIQAIETHNGTSVKSLAPRRANSRHLRSKKSQTDQKSALLGISEDMRQAIKDSWALISAKSGPALGVPEASNLNKFFEYATA